MILDTSYIVALDDENPGALALSRRHDAAGVPQRLPSILLLELYIGVGAGTQSYHNARKYEELVGNLPVVGLDENIARRAGALEGIHQMHDDKSSLGVRDAVIAATGLVYNEPVVTDDTGDFGGVDGLRVETWA